MIGIYKIISPSDKVYIGQSWEIEKRWYNYKSYSCEGQMLLYRSLKKYGAKAHKFEVLHELPTDIEQNILNQYEVLYIQLYKAAGFSMLNLAYGGEGGKHQESTKKKISESLKDKGIKPPSQLGATISASHKNALNSGRKNSKNTDWHNQQIRDYNNSDKGKEQLRRLALMKCKTWVIIRDGVLVGKFLSATEASKKTGFSKSKIYGLAAGQLNGSKGNSRTAGLKIYSE